MTVADFVLILNSLNGWLVAIIAILIAAPAAIIYRFSFSAGAKDARLKAHQERMASLEVKHRETMAEIGGKAIDGKAPLPANQRIESSRGDFDGN